jgi:type IV pilus assembly protein PilY1
MDQQRDMFNNPEGDHLYGMDVTPTVFVTDHNGNGIIERPDSNSNNDTVYAYVAMRSGGKGIYALDLSGEMSSATSSITPKYLWRIQGGSGSFTRLGYTWSRPTLAKIETTTGVLNVLIFGGGYDNSLEDDESFGTASSGGNDNIGNAIYIVNALTGAKILSIAGNSTGGTDGDIEVPNMKFSIPSRITVQDSNRDGIHDRLYVGDTAGQVWRVDLGNDILASGGITAAATCQADANCDQTLVGRLATISNSAVVADQRRFFEAPSVVQVLDTEYADGIGSEYDYILLGSGNRAHPLNEDVSDRFYAFRDVHIDGMVAQSGKNLAADYPKVNVPGGEGTPIGHTVANELVNITSQTLQDAVDASIDVGNSLGWYFDFNLGNTSGGTLLEPGEKVLSSPIAIAGTVFFTTYLPSEDQSDPDICVGQQIGSGRAYNLDILNARAAIDWDGDGDIDLADRGTELGGGIPSDVVPVFTKEGVVGIVGIEGGATQLGTLAGLPRFRTYWYEE